jgi:hypothetical protein
MALSQPLLDPDPPLRSLKRQYSGDKNLIPLRSPFLNARSPPCSHSALSDGSVYQFFQRKKGNSL